MYRTRLLPTYSADELKKVYRKPHDSRQWWDHNVRVAVTIAVGAAMLPTERSGLRIADLSAGNGLIAQGIAQSSVRRAELVLGDFAFADRPLWLHGPIEETLDQIEPVDLFVLSETLEHLDDPDFVLRKIREKTDALVLSTPNGETTGIFPVNPEHYWGWDNEAVQAMLAQAGFEEIIIYNELVFPHSIYDFQIWGVR